MMALDDGALHQNQLFLSTLWDIFYKPGVDIDSYTDFISRLSTATPVSIAIREDVCNA